jgi:hypothetical protein
VFEVPSYVALSLCKGRGLQQFCHLCAVRADVSTRPPRPLEELKIQNVCLNGSKMIQSCGNLASKAHAQCQSELRCIAFILLGNQALQLCGLQYTNTHGACCNTTQVGFRLRRPNPSIGAKGLLFALFHFTVVGSYRSSR